MNTKWLKQERQGRKRLLKISRNSQRQGRIRTCPKIASVIVALVPLLALLVEQSSDVKLFEVSTSLSSSSLLVFSPLTAAEPSDAYKLKHSDSNDPSLLESSASSASSTPPPKPSMKPKHSMYEYPKELQYIPSDQLQPKDYFSGSFFVSRDTFLRQLKPRHFVKLESASLETSANVKTAKMMVDWTCLAVEHFSHWWKTLYRIHDYITTMDTMDNRTSRERTEAIFEKKEHQQRMLMDRIVQIFQEYIQVTAPQQLHWKLEYHDHLLSSDGNPTTAARSEEEHPMQRTIAAIAFQPYRLPIDNTNLTSSSSSSSTKLLPSPQQLQLQDELEELLTIHSLAATIASLVAAGFGRVLVVGYQHDQKEHYTENPIAAAPSCVEKAFRLVQAAFPHPTITLDSDAPKENTKNDVEESPSPHAKDEKPPPPTTTSTSTTTTTTTSLGYAAIADDTWVRNYRRKKLFNLQMGVVTGLQLALKGYMQYNMTRAQEWLGHYRGNGSGSGDGSGGDGDGNGDGALYEYWKYVFLTEPDLLLHTKPWTLSLMAKGMDEEGLSYFPHRLQPLPHQADFAILRPGTDDVDDGAHKEEGEKANPLLYSYLLPDDTMPFSNITTLRYLQDDSDDSDDFGYCCDEMTNDYPGRAKEFGWRQHQFPCDDWWWTCGYVHHDLDNTNKRKKKDDSSSSIIEKKNSNSTSSSSSSSSRKKQYCLRLARYPMLRLQRGSGVVFGSTEQGRRCIPQKGPCSVEAN